METKILVGGISPEGETILRTYIDKFLPDAKIEPLSPNGVKGRMKNHASRPDVVLVIIDEILYQTCVGVADDVLRMKKVHKYVDDAGLKQFLISRFGVLNPGAESVSPAAPIVGMVHAVSEADDVDLGTVTEEIDNSSETIKRLTEELAQEKLLVQNLTLQLKDSQDSGDIAELVARIRELEVSVAEKDEELKNQANNAYADLGKVARADQIIGQLDTLKEELQAEKEAKSALEYDLNNLTGRIEEYEKQIAGLEGRVAADGALQQQITELENKAAERERSLVSELEGKAAELEGKDAEIQVLQNELSGSAELVKTIDDLKAQLEGKKLELSNLMIDFDAKKKEYDILQEDSKTAQARVVELEQAVSEKEAEIARCMEQADTVSGLQAEIDSLKGEIQGLKDAVAKKDALLADKDDLVASLQGDLDGLAHKDAEIAMLNEQISGYTTTMEQLNQNITASQATVSALNAEIQSLKEKALIQQDAMQVKSEALDEAIAGKKDLESRLVSLEEEKVGVESKLAEAQNSISEQEKRISSLVDEGTKLQNQITSLEGSLTEAKTDTAVVDKLQKDLLDSRREAARLSSEIEVLRKNGDSSQATELRIEVARLKGALDKANLASANSEEVEKLRADLEAAREHSAALEIKLAEKDESNRDFESGVFYQLSNLVMDKAMNGVVLSALPELPNKFICTVAATMESAVPLYQLLLRSCKSSNKRVIFVDLATDTSIEREFKVVGNVTGAEWLHGKAPVSEFIASTRLPNVKVVYIAPRYLNELSLLVVDWASRLAELQDLADCIILNVGCLNSMVSKLLFNTFGQVMPVHTIVKATPINMRTAYLGLLGLRQMDVIVDCVNFDGKASKEMYQNLAKKYKTRILHDSDVLDI